MPEITWRNVGSSTGSGAALQDTGNSQFNDGADRISESLQSIINNESKLAQQELDLKSKKITNDKASTTANLALEKEILNNTKQENNSKLEALRVQSENEKERLKIELDTQFNDELYNLQDKEQQQNSTFTNLLDQANTIDGVKDIDRMGGKLSIYSISEMESIIRRDNPYMSATQVAAKATESIAQANMYQDELRGAADSVMSVEDYNIAEQNIFQKHRKSQKEYANRTKNSTLAPKGLNQSQQAILAARNAQASAMMTSIEDTANEQIAVLEAPVQEYNKDKANYKGTPMSIYSKWSKDNKIESNTNISASEKVKARNIISKLLKDDEFKNMTPYHIGKALDLINIDPESWGDENEIANVGKLENLLRDNIRQVRANESDIRNNGESINKEIAEIRKAKELEKLRINQGLLLFGNQIASSAGQFNSSAWKNK